MQSCWLVQMREAEVLERTEDEDEVTGDGSVGRRGFERRQMMVKADDGGEGR